MSKAIRQSARQKNGLRFPFDDLPEPDRALEIAPDLFWTRMPLPMQGLDHINLYLIGHDDGFSIVDTGMKYEPCYEHWKKLLAGQLHGKKIHQIFVTHMHPDHVGLAGWLTRQHDCELYMSRLEYLTCRMLAGDTGRDAPQAGIDFFRKAGFPESAIESYQKRFGLFGRMISRLPDSYQRLSDGQMIRLGKQNWRVVTGCGHSPEHACFYNAQDDYLISGDQVLPAISSNVSVHPTEPEANPLRDWLESCKKLRAQVSDDVLVLPSHNTPFFGLHERLKQLENSHARCLNRLKIHLADGPKTVPECFSPLFKRPIEGTELGLATGEAIAHLNYLRFTENEKDRVERRLNEAGLYEYRLTRRPDSCSLKAWQENSKKDKREAHYV